MKNFTTISTMLCSPFGKLALSNSHRTIATMCTALAIFLIIFAGLTKSVNSRGSPNV